MRIFANQRADLMKSSSLQLSGLEYGGFSQSPHVYPSPSRTIIIRSECSDVLDDWHVEWKEKIFRIQTLICLIIIIVFTQRIIVGNCCYLHSNCVKYSQCNCSGSWSRFTSTSHAKHAYFLLVVNWHFFYYYYFDDEIFKLISCSIAACISAYLFQNCMKAHSSFIYLYALMLWPCFPLLCIHYWMCPAPVPCGATKNEKFKLFRPDDRHLNTPH